MSDELYVPDPAPVVRPRLQLPDGREAPQLLVQFQCPVCFVAEIRDAYRGVPLHRCRFPHPIMVAERIVDPADVA